MAEAREHGSTWTFKKEISLPDLIAIIMAVVLPLGAYYTLKTEVELVKIRVEQNETLVKDGKEDSRALKQELREDIREIKLSLQRMSERNERR